MIAIQKERGGVHLHLIGVHEDYEDERPPEETTDRGEEDAKTNIEGDSIEPAHSQLEKDGQDVLNWSQPRWRMTKKDIIGTETIL